MKNKTLLATVAAAALFAGSGLAMAEGAGKEGGAPGGGGAQMQQRGGAEMNRGAEQKGGAEMKGGAEHKAQTTGQDTKSDNKAGTKADNKADNKADSNTKSTTGQAAPSEHKSQTQSKESPATNKNQAQEKAQPDRTQAQDQRQAPANRNQAQENRQQQPAGQAQGNRSGSPTTGQGAAGSTQAGGSVNLTTEQKTTIRQTVIQSSSAPKVQRSQVNFNISVGTVVPRGGVVRFAPLPTTIVEIHPAWRGYQYFVVDEEIIIIEPTSYKIVAVLNV